MAVKKKVVELETGNALKSVKSLRSELKELKDQLINLDKSSEQYAETLQKAANIQHDLKELTEELAASAMDFGQVLGNITSTVGGVISGFQALTASMSLLGIENEEALETIKKLQGLMALTQGIAGVEKGIKSFKRLVNIISNSTLVTKLFNMATKETVVVENTASTATKGMQAAMTSEAAATNAATVATNAFKKALISTGLGAIIVAIGVLVANMDKLVKVFSSSAREAERQAEAMRKLKRNIEDINSTVKYYEKEIKKLSSAHRQEIKDMDKIIEKMKALGKSEAAISAQQEKFNKRRAQIYQEEINDINKAQKAIENYFKKEKNILLDRLNAYDSIHNYQNLIIKNERIINDLESGKNVSGYTKESIEILKQRNERLNMNIEQLEKWLELEESELDLLDEINDMDNKISNERIATRRKLIEELLKFDNQNLIESIKDQEKELAQVDFAESEKLKTLKKYLDEGIITKEQYERKETQITEAYNKRRAEIIAKYLKQDTEKTTDELNKRFSIERRKLDVQRNEYSHSYNQEHNELVKSLSTREITLSEYYNGEIDLISNSLKKEKELINLEYEREKDLLADLYSERGKLLQVPGLSDEEKKKIELEMEDLLALLEQSISEHNLIIQQLELDATNKMRELYMLSIEEEMNFLRDATDAMAITMDAIISSGDGLSAHWTNAFTTMSNGIINLTQKIREGGAAWQDYAQMAVAAFLAAGSIMNALADQQDTETKEGFEQQKKYQIAATTMNMLGGVISAWTSALNPANAWMTIYGQLAMGAATTAMILATGITQIQKIQQQQFNSSSVSAKPSSSAMGSLIAPIQYTQDVQGAQIEGAIKDSRVYVVESDITDAQEKVSVTESEARY